MKLNVLAAENKHAGNMLFENCPHIRQSFMLWFSFHSIQTASGDLWCFSASQAVAVWACFLSLFHLRPANKTRRYNQPLWPLNLTARLLNTSKTLKRKSVSLFLPLSFPLFSFCTAGTCPSSFSPPARDAVALSESSEFPVHCSVSAWKHHRCQRLVSFKENRESDRMKMSVMANRTLSHSYNIFVTDYQTGDSNTHTTNIRQMDRSTRGALKTLKEPDNTDLD